MLSPSFRLRLRHFCLDIGGGNDDVYPLRLDRLDLLAGHVYVLFGESGVGKTTFLESLAGLRSPRHAEQFTLTDLDGRSHNLADFYMADKAEELTSLRADAIGYVPQGTGVLPFLTARQNVLLGTAHPKMAADRLQQLAHWFDIEAHLTKRRSELSGGQRKRVALMRGLIKPRALLLLDEPTSGLDGEMADKALDAVQLFVSKEQSCALIVMHDIDRALRNGLTVLELKHCDDRSIQMVNAQGLAA